MRLDFNALWVDDQPSTIKSYADRLSMSMKRDGFELKVTSATSVKEAVAHVSGSVFGDLFDLVLVDYDLGQGPTGDIALRDIRNLLNFKELIFYSANSAGRLKRLAFDQNVEGVFCTSRNDLVQTALGVFEALIKKVLDVDHSRGIVLGATSDIDHIVHDALLCVHDKLDGTKKGEMLGLIHGKIDEKLSAMAKRATDAKTGGTMGDALELYDLVTAFDKLRLLMDVLDKANPEEKDIRTKIGRYTADVVPKRNILGHVQMVMTKSGRVLRSRDGKKELSESDLRDLRRELIEHRDNFHELADILGIKLA